MQPILWIDAEPARLQRDLDEIPAFCRAGASRYLPPGDSAGELELTHGGWCLELPLWPFDRPEPAGLEQLTGGLGLTAVLEYPAAYPMTWPTVHPIQPEPLVQERTQSAWHVLPSGGLCLLQTDGQWRPEASVTELLLKAAGWRIEYALMKTGAVEQMSVQGIVSDPGRDYLIADAAGSTSHASNQDSADGPQQ